jgi:hypothetical protein
MSEILKKYSDFPGLLSGFFYHERELSVLGG